MQALTVPPFSVALVGVLIAAGTDVWKFRLHNVLTIPFLISGLVYHAVVEGSVGLAGGVLGVLAGGLPFLVVYAKGGMGAGDIKLLAGVGAWLGPWAVLHVLIVSGLATGCYSAAICGWNRMQRRRDAGIGAAGNGQPGVPSDPGVESAGAAHDVTDVLARADKRRHAVPFGAMVALGVVITALWIG